VREIGAFDLSVLEILAGRAGRELRQDLADVGLRQLHLIERLDGSETRRRTAHRTVRAASGISTHLNLLSRFRHQAINGDHLKRSPRSLTALVHFGDTRPGPGLFGGFASEDAIANR
jgi:hypothetical protein